MKVNFFYIGTRDYSWTIRFTNEKMNGWDACCLLVVGVFTKIKKFEKKKK